MVTKKQKEFEKKSAEDSIKDTATKIIKQYDKVFKNLST